MAIPEGYSALAKLGYADKGNYSASATYMAQDVVYHNGSSWVCKVDNTKGVTPAEGNNWHYLARGFAAETAAEITATDTNNILGSGANKTGPLQTLLNKITDFIVNRAISNDNFVAKLSERLVNNGTTNQAGFALDARFGKSLQDQVSVLTDRTSGIYMRHIRMTPNLETESDHFLINIPPDIDINKVRVIVASNRNDVTDEAYVIACKTNKDTKWYAYGNTKSKWVISINFIIFHV